MNARARGNAQAVAAANRAAAAAANSHEAAFARERALFLGAAGAEGPEAPGGKADPAAQRARRREGAARFGRKALAAFMAVVLAVGLMPLPAFGDDGTVRGVSFNGNLIAGSISTTTTVDADGNATTETTQTKVDDEGNVVSETTSSEDGGLDSDANLRGQYYLGQATSLKSDGTIQDLAGTGDIGKVADGSDSRLSVAAGAQALKDKESEAGQSAVDEAQAAFDAEDAQLDISGLDGMDFSSQRVVVALKDGASLMERDLNNVTSRADSMYVLSYKDQDAAKRAYVRYARYDGAEFAAPDAAVEASDGGDDDDDDPDAGLPDVPRTESGDVDYTKVAKDGAGADGAQAPETDAPEVDTSTYEADARDLADGAEGRAEEEAGKTADEKTAVVVVIDTMVAQDLPVARRLSVLAEGQETVADGDPDYDSKLEAQRATHGSKMVETIVGQLEAGGACIVDAEGNRLAGSEGGGARKVQVISIEALDSSNYGSAASVLVAAQLALRAAPDVVNMSFAGHATEGNAAISEAVKLLADGPDAERGTADDAAVIAAAGNQDADARWFVPASSDGAYAVGALDEAKVAALREQAARELFASAADEGGAISLDDAQAAQLDTAIAERVAVDSADCRLETSNHGDMVSAWLIASSTSYAAALASGYAAANIEGWRGSIAASPLAVGDSREFAANALPDENAAADADGGESASDAPDDVAGGAAARVVFVDDSGEATGVMGPLEVTDGSFVIPSPGYELEGYHFSSWMTDVAGDGARARIPAGTAIENWRCPLPGGADVDLRGYLEPSTESGGDGAELVLHAEWSEGVVGYVARLVEAEAGAHETDVVGAVVSVVDAMGAQEGVWAAASPRSDNAVATYGLSAGKATYDGTNKWENIVYSRSGQPIKLFGGKYLLEAWGATGGGSVRGIGEGLSNTGANSYKGYVGHGGYSYGVIDLSDRAATTVYAIVGERGVTSNVPYNGGGYNAGSYNAGGMTHFTLSNLDTAVAAAATGSITSLGAGSWDQSGTLLVAGGGGGVDNGDGTSGCDGGGFVNSSHVSEGTVNGSISGYNTQRPDGTPSGVDVYKGSTEWGTETISETQVRGNRKGAGQSGIAGDLASGGGGWMGGFSGIQQGAGGGGTGHLGDRDGYWYEDGSEMPAETYQTDSRATLPDGTTVVGHTEYGGKTYEITGSVYRYLGNTVKNETTSSPDSYRYTPAGNWSARSGTQYDGYARVRLKNDYTITYHNASGTVIGYGGVDAGGTTTAPVASTLYNASTFPQTRTVDGHTVRFIGWRTSNSDNLLGADAGLVVEWAGELRFSATGNLDLYPAYGNYEVEFSAGDAERGSGESFVMGAFDTGSFTLPAGDGNGNVTLSSGTLTSNDGYLFDEWEVYYTAASGEVETPARARIPGGATIKYDADGWKITALPSGATGYSVGDQVGWVAQAYTDDSTPKPNGPTDVATNTTVHVRAIWKYDSLSTRKPEHRRPHLGQGPPAAGFRGATRCKRRRPGGRRAGAGTGEGA